MKKKTIFAAVGVGLAAFMGLAGVKLYQKKKEALEETQAVELIRDYFSQKGEIATVYILAYETTPDHFYGGVVMADDRRYVFELEDGRLHYHEEKE